MESRAPLRTCIGCRRRMEQAQLLRIGRNSGGQLTLSQEKHRFGRGAYVCPEPGCLDAALKGDRLAKALRKPVSAEDKETLRQSRFDPTPKPDYAN